jgi:hypothetical protein
LMPSLTKDKILKPVIKLNNYTVFTSLLDKNNLLLPTL